IGLEIHVQLNTKSKLFCPCDNDSSKAEPNINICPICTGHPGHLPLTNKAAIEKAAELGLALGCKIAEKSVFDRKNYFYPDLPAGYQITQMHCPIALNGELEIILENNLETKKVRINRAHVESDAGKLIHKQGNSYVDWNRSGTPLVEIVTEPDLRSGAEAKAFFENIRAIARYTDVSDGDLENGHLRCDANISLRKKGDQKFGTRTEIKNLNSFRAVESAINYEVERQAQILDANKKVIQETRGWDDMQKMTVSQRGKEESHDYRYFPEPDIPPLHHEKKWIAQIKSTLPKLPIEKYHEFIKLEMPQKEARTLALNAEIAMFFSATTAICKNPKQVARWLLTEHFGRLAKNNQKFSETKFLPKDLAELISLIDKNEISSKIGKDVFDEMFETGIAPETIIKKHNWKQISGAEFIEHLIEEVIAENPLVVSKYASGDNRVFGFFIGAVMKKSQGQANPKLTNELLEKKLNAMR
ncbi:MAG: Asp-tRNA(Asn)/Glu-tRNA(Gln) amidotransferase subunit GatB, partial [Patescibacteria group bacterium]|nr:Asp-tRNA(Asn)/Glu-tRNA(Gln) amidotransferase subunit GatB [Patescibacteria group bacterium]